MKYELKEKYKTDFATVRKLINEFDPTDLIKCGAPLDEYDSLSNIIVSSIYNNKSISETSIKIISEIQNSFEYFIPNQEIANYTLKLEEVLNTIFKSLNNKHSH